MANISINAQLSPEQINQLAGVFRNLLFNVFERDLLNMDIEALRNEISQTLRDNLQTYQIDTQIAE